jgi:hypothetical protein
MTEVALVELTVSMEELPAAIVVGLAPIFTVGVAGGVLKLPPPPQPANARRTGNINAIARDEEIQLRDRWAHAFIA